MVNILSFVPGNVNKYYTYHLFKLSFDVLTPRDISVLLSGHPAMKSRELMGGSSVPAGGCDTDRLLPNRERVPYGTAPTASCRTQSLQRYGEAGRTGSSSAHNALRATATACFP